MSASSPAADGQVRVALPLYPASALEAAGSGERQWLTQLASRDRPAGGTLRGSVRLDPASRVKAMDETRSRPGALVTARCIRAISGRSTASTMKFASRSTRHGRPISSAMRWAQAVANAVLLTDGYAAYEQYARRRDQPRALLDAFAQRIFDALTAEPTGAAEALEQIKALYAIEDEIAIASSSGKPGNCIV